jgi:hypothetical protein
MPGDARTASRIAARLAVRMDVTPREARMRRIPRLVPLVAGAALVAAALGSPARADEDARTKSFKDHNFRLTIPESWAWAELTEVERGAGFAVIARRTVSEGVEASARVRVVDAAGSSLDSMLSQIKDAKTKDLQGVVAEERDLEWAGVPARRLEISGKYEGGASTAIEVYGTIASGKFHQLDVRCINGAEEKLRDELNELAAGYAFLEAPLTGAEAAAPKPQEFAQFKLVWTLPAPKKGKPAKEDEPSPTLRWLWGAGSSLKPDTAPGQNGTLAAAVLDVDGVRPVVIELITQKAPVGMTAQAVVEHEPNFLGFVDNFSSIPAPRIDREAEVGNLLGASRTLNGKDKQDPPRPLNYRIYFTVLGDVLFQVLVTAHDDAESHRRAEIRDALAGLHWEGVKMGVRGPRVTPFPTYTDARKDAMDAGKDTTVVQGQITLKKPAAFARMKFDATERSMKDYLFSAEARKENAYVWVGIKRWPLKVFTDSSPPRGPESEIDALESDWKNEMDDAVTLTQKNGKANKSPDGVAGAKGHAYEFRGTKDKTPYVEKGWTVKDGLNAFHIRVQYGGKDAEAAFAPDVKALLKSVKFGK